MIDRDTLYQIWAPDESPWSPWVKPVPFAFWPRSLSEPATDPVAPVEPEMNFPSAKDGCALVLDLPGHVSIARGLRLARLGFRPVPVFASCPDTSYREGFVRSAVNADRILAALVTAAPSLQEQPIPIDAPPAFLLDAGRFAPGVIITSGLFDNRSAVFASDFPSAAVLRRQGITQVAVVRDAAIPTGPDLPHALDHWRRAGIEVSVRAHDGTPVEFRWPRVGFLGALLNSLAMAIRLRPNERGGFGRYIAESSGG
jgi:hypothetical protein